MTDSSARTFSSDFKRFFLRGLVILLPSVLTLWIVVKAYQFIDSTIAEPINQGVRLAMVNTAKVWSPLRATFDPPQELIDEKFNALPQKEKVQPDLKKAQLQATLRAENIHQWWTERWYLDLIGLIVAIVAVYVAGRLLGGYIGRRVYWRLERMLTSVPVFKHVYPYVKQIVDFLFSDEQPMKFNRVVVVEYPRKGIWSLGFHTGSTMKDIGTHAGDAITIFIPSSPTPFTGYTITVPRNEVIEVPISVEEAIRFTVSAGVLVPGTQEIASSSSDLDSISKKLPEGLIAVSEKNTGEK